MKSMLIIPVATLVFALANQARSDDAKAPPASPKDEKAAAGKGAYESSFDRIVQECGVAEANREQLAGLLRGWDEDSRNAVAQAAPTDPDQSKALAEKLAAIDKEIDGASHLHHADMIRDLTEKRKMVVDAMQGWNAETRKLLEDVDAKYQAAIREIVPPEKAERLDEILTAAQDAQPYRPRRGPVRSPRALKAIVDRLGDLTPEQRRSIEGAFLEHREAQRAGGPDQNKALQDKQLYDNVFAFLTDGQKTRVEQELAGRQAAPAAPSAPAQPGASTPAKPVTPVAPPQDKPAGGKP